jgi:hypothetical protein
MVQKGHFDTITVKSGGTIYYHNGAGCAGEIVSWVAVFRFSGIDNVFFGTQRGFQRRLQR